MSPADRVTRLRALWTEILNVDTVRDDQHFLELGGDSIAATLCLNAVADEFDVTVPMTMLLEENVTFRVFARNVERTLADATSRVSSA